nr:hypothetical protein [Bacteroidota bacterium]
MKSKFEKYLESNRDKLDVENPDDILIWDGISSEFRGRRVFRRNLFWKAAAIFLFLISSVYIIYSEFVRPNQQVYRISLGDVDPMYSDHENLYLDLIKTKLGEVNSFGIVNKNQLNPYFDELNSLDEMFAEYQADYFQVGKNERLVRAMLDYYDKKVRVLDRILLEIQKQKDYENKQNQIEL